MPKFERNNFSDYTDELIVLKTPRSSLPCNHDSVGEPKQQDKGEADDDGDPDLALDTAALTIARILLDRWLGQGPSCGGSGKIV